MQRFKFQHPNCNVVDIDLAISCFTSVLVTIPHEFIPGLLVNLGVAHTLRYNSTHDPHSLDSAIRHLQHAADNFPTLHDEIRSVMFNNLGIAYRRRVHHTDTCKAGDLDQAISNLKQALELTDVDDVGRCARMANLGNCYYSRFNHSFDSDDITQAILWHENAVNSARASPPERSRALICLGMSLCRRYEHTKDPAHVQKAISAYREAATQADVDPVIRLDAAEEWALHSIHHPPDVVHHLGSMTLGKATLMQVNIEKDNSEFLMAYGDHRR